MTVGELRQRMPQVEYVAWQAYYALRAQRMEVEEKKASRGR